MTKIVKAFVFLLAIVLVVQCDREQSVEAEGDGNPLQELNILSFDALPAEIQSKIITAETELKATDTHHKALKPFGSPKFNTIHQRLGDNGSQSYTLGLEKTGEGLYYDNLVINQDAEGNTRTHIIRYQPESSWYRKHKTEGLGYPHYSGAIHIFSETGTLLSSVTLASGIPVQKTTQDNTHVGHRANDQEMTCEVIDIEYVGGCAGEECWWSEIIITLNCTGAGGGGSDGMYDEGGYGQGGANGPQHEDGQHGGGGGGSPVNTVPVEEDEPVEEDMDDDIIIDLSFLENFPCQAQIVQEIYSNCAPLSQLFQDIFESNDHVDVTFTAEELQGILDGGNTNGEHPHNYLITLNTLRLNQSTELDLINTTTHEYVHAIMFHYFYSGHFQLTDAGNPPTYAELAEGFAKHRAGFGGNHHPYMASLVNDIAEVTYAWAIAHDYTPNDFTDYDTNPEDDIDGLKEFLRKFAWSGLEETPSYNHYYPYGTLVRQELQNLIHDEIFPNYENTNEKGNLPVPCN